MRTIGRRPNQTNPQGPAITTRQYSPTFQVNRSQMLNLIRGGAPAHAVVQRMVDDYGVTQTIAQAHLKSMMREIAQANQDDLMAMRTLSLTRLQMDLLKMRSMRTPPWHAIRGHESLIADLQGTKQTHVHVTHGTNTQDVYKALLEGMHESRLEAIARAQLAHEKRLGIDPRQLVITHAETSG